MSNHLTMTRHLTLLLFLIVTIQLASAVPKQQRSKSSKNFCASNNCSCTTATELKCQFNSSVKSIEFFDPSVLSIDFSDNSLETFVFGDTPLNLKNLNLRNNTIRVINDALFDKMPHLYQLDLSQNKIDDFKETSLQYLNVLNRLNLSNAFASGYQITRELCELVSLKVLDLSFLNLESFTLECWKTSAHIVELHLQHTVNADVSWSNWFPYIGTDLRLIDLTNSSIKQISPNLALNMNNLLTLILSDNEQLNKNSLFTLLNTNRLKERLENLYLDKIDANSTNLPLGKLISMANSTSLKVLDISNNNYDDDLNEFLFNQNSLGNLTTFKATSNQFWRCDKRLIDPNNSLLRKLTYLDLSYNYLNGSSCLYSIKSVKTLKTLDLNHNLLTIISSDIQARDFSAIFAHMLNLTYIDLSYNRFQMAYFYFDVGHANIERFDLSHNKLKMFRILPLTMLNKAKFPFNIEGESLPEEYEDVNTQYYDEDDDTTVVGNKHDINDDDERFLIVNVLDLSNNRFSLINVENMFQSLKNIISLDMNSNPIEQVIGMTGDPLIIDGKLANQSKTFVESSFNVNKEILCIDDFDLTNCKIRRMPDLQHACVNRMTLVNNLLSGSVLVTLSNYTLYFLDYLDLRSNNITKLKFAISGQKYIQDNYVVQNSPVNFFYGNANKTQLNHTSIDLRHNDAYKCECEMVKVLDSLKYVKIISPCFVDAEIEKCRDSMNANPSTKIASLNRKLRMLFIITCIILAILCTLIIYYMCAEFFKSNSLYDYSRIKMSRVLGFFKLKNKYDSNSSTSSQRENIGVQYSKLVNEAGTVSHIDINNN